MRRHIARHESAMAMSAPMTKRNAMSGAMKAIAVSTSERRSSPNDRSGFPAPAVPAVDTGRIEARPA